MNSNSISYALVFLFCVTSVLFPVFILNKLVFVPLLLLSVYCFFLDRLRTFSPFLIFLVFIYGFVLALFTNSDFALARQMLFGSVTLFLIYLIISQEIDMSRLLKSVGIVFASAMCFGAVMIMLLPSSAISTQFLGFYTRNELGFYGVRNFGGLQMFMLHHRASPFMIIPLCLFFVSFLQGRKRDIFWVAIILMAVFFTASRALMLMSGLSIVALYFFNRGWVVRLAVLALAVPVLTGAFFYLLTATSMFNLDETSNSIKVGHLVSFYHQLDLGTLLMGNGIGNFFYTSGYGLSVAQTEITWMDTIRFFGLPLSVVLLLSIVMPGRDFKLHDRECFNARLIMLIYLLISMSNPVLFNSFGFIVILWYWGVLLRFSTARPEGRPVYHLERSCP
jgi:hypothetical protein